VLFGSILLYSLANISNGFVISVNQLCSIAIRCRNRARRGIGAGITLVSEILPIRLRSYGTTLVASVGLMGAVFANFIARRFDCTSPILLEAGLAYYSDRPDQHFRIGCIFKIKRNRPCSEVIFFSCSPKGNG